MLFKPTAGKITALEAGKIQIQDLNEFAKSLRTHNQFVQVCYLKAICSPKQAQIALEHALSAEEQNTAFSKSLQMEFLLRLAAEPQIEKALEKVGLKEAKPQEALAIALGETKAEAKQALQFLQKLGFKPNPKLLEPQNLKKNSAYIKKIYSLSEQELKALSSLPNPLLGAVTERIALTSLQERSQ